MNWESLLWILIGISCAAQAAYRAGYNAGWRDRGRE